MSCSLHVFTKNKFWIYMNFWPITTGRDRLFVMYFSEKKNRENSGYIFRFFVKTCGEPAAHLRLWTIQLLKSVHFKKTVARSSFLSKVWYFSVQHQLTSKQSELMLFWKVPQFWKKWGSRATVLFKGTDFITLYVKLLLMAKLIFYDFKRLKLNILRFWIDPSMIFFLTDLQRVLNSL